MKGKVFIVHWKSKKTKEYKKMLREEGWIVESESENGRRAFERIKTNQPDAVVIDLNRRPKRGREVGFTLNTIRITHHLPVVFVHSRKEVRSWAKKRVPKAVCSNPKKLTEKLEKYSKKDDEDN